MSDHTPWPLIAKYLAGECSPEEKLAMEWWLENYDNHQLFKQIQSAWQNEQEPAPEPEFNAESGLARLNSLISEADSSADEPVEKRFNYFKISSWMAAASVAVLIGLGYFFVNKNNEKKTLTRLDYSEKVSGKDEIVKLVLPDGSEVWLNKNSKIAYPKAFEADQREVYLEGEAFFEVVPNPSKPFIVHSDKVSTRVLGTSFNVKAYKGDELASVSVATGKVEVSKEIERGTSIRITQLTPQQELVINTEKDETYIDIVSTFDIGGWRRDPLVFRNNTYTEVIASLEKQYNVTIDLKNKNLSQCRVMASFNEGANLKSVLELLSISNSFRYTIDGSQVTILGGVCR
ncbi:FecR family protein [Dyadobacter pollutisoli]|uniref:FecR domain-containing protein n=1 Tax=Dyadobacter pollutisoli TaxID=2910158 RepID=A0A9E8SJ42_9BACT|nr:FecR domain-containing protein [Dyadobacter pollutisoli]WAC09331.1 FecR domain-containing protein [Dyadobacter pollutisoli]